MKRPVSRRSCRKSETSWWRARRANPSRVARVVSFWRFLPSASLHTQRRRGPARCTTSGRHRCRSIGRNARSRRGRCGSLRLVPTDRDPVSVGRDRPLPAGASLIDGVRAGSLATEGRLVLGAVDRFVEEALEHAGVGLLVDPSPQSGPGSVAEPPSDAAGTSGDQTVQGRFETGSVVASGPVTAQRLGVDGSFG